MASKELQLDQDVRVLGFVDGLPDIVLDQIGCYLNSVDLLALSHTTSKMFNYLSTKESLWKNKLVSEHMDTDSPRLLEKAEELGAAFPVSCMSKRIFLVRQKTRQNVRAGNLVKVSEITLDAPLGKTPGMTVVNDDVVVFFSGGRNSSIKIYKLATREWKSLKLLEGPRECQKALVSGQFAAAVYDFDYSSASAEERVATFNEMEGNIPVHKHLVVVDISGEEPHIAWSQNFGLHYKFLLSESKIFSFKQIADLWFLESVDITSGSTIRVMPVGKFNVAFYGGAELLSDNVLSFRHCEWRSEDDFDFFSNFLDIAKETMLSMPSGSLTPYFVLGDGKPLQYVSNVRVVGRESGAVFAHLRRTDVCLNHVTSFDGEVLTMRRQRIRLSPELDGDSVLQDDCVDATIGQEIPDDRDFSDDDLENDFDALLLEGLLVILSEAGQNKMSLKFIDASDGTTVNQIVLDGAFDWHQLNLKRIQGLGMFASRSAVAVCLRSDESMISLQIFDAISSD